MKVLQMAVGGMGTNAYIAFREGLGKAFVVDPGAECDRILAVLDENGIEEVTHILLTHGHFDHIGAVADLKRATAAKVCIHTRDINMLRSQRDNLAALAGLRIPECEADIVLWGGETINAADMDVYVLHTPGHSGGSVCYMTDGTLFAGDTLFYMGCGRTDLPGSDPEEYFHTLTDILGAIKKDYTVYTGHGPKTTLFAEFRSNPYLAR
ncbi:MAG: MBL fold metallo-hydrolase [Christensenellales bacterium]|jgi:hydroxyacylglutathione hydrolase